MRAMIVSCVFPPEPVVSSRTSGDLARHLANGGHDVAVICPFPNRPNGKVFAGYSRRWRKREQLDGAEVTRCFATISRRSTLASRLMENLSFGITSMLAVLGAKRPDVIYSNSWPLFATGLVAFAARLRRVPYVVSVQDVYPDSLIAQRRIAANGFPARVLRWLDGLIARGAKAVIVLSENFADVYRRERGMDPKRVHVIPNWLPSSAVDGDPADGRAYRAERGIADQTTLLVYGGNIGAAAGVDQVIDAFEQLRGEDIHLLIAGDGSEADACERRSRGLERVTMHRPWPAADTSRVLGAADLFVLPTQGEQGLVSVPSKLISYMLAARPVLAITDPRSETARILDEAGAGWIVAPGEVDAVVRAIRAAAGASAEERKTRGENARKYALGHFVSEACLPRVAAIVQEAAR
jgi:glycosyltransferase involved in cell wall biosynthesis